MIKSERRMKQKKSQNTELNVTILEFENQLSNSYDEKERIEEKTTSILLQIEI